VAILHHLTQGAGPPVVLLHPVGLDLTFWRPVAERLVHRFTVYAFDQKGHGLSPPVPQGHCLADYVDDTARSLQALIHKRVTVLGSSFGGMLAQPLTLRHPSLVSRLVLCGCPCTFSNSLRPQIAERGAAAERGGMKAVIEATLLRWFNRAFIDAGGAEAVRQRLLSDDVSGWATGWRAISELDNASGLKTLSIPALCVAGEHDEAVPPAAVERLAAQIPASRYVVVPVASHMMHIENMDGFTNAIWEFLQLDVGS
jgi:3-oxoadipate enol-lactonase